MDNDVIILVGTTPDSKDWLIILVKGSQTTSTQSLTTDIHAPSCSTAAPERRFFTTSCKVTGSKNIDVEKLP